LQKLNEVVIGSSCSGHDDGRDQHSECELVTSGHAFSSEHLRFVSGLHAGVDLGGCALRMGWAGWRNFMPGL